MDIWTEIFLKQLELLQRGDSGVDLSDFEGLLEFDPPSAANDDVYIVPISSSRKPRSIWDYYADTTMHPA